MASNELSVDVDVSDAVERMNDIAQEDLDDGAKDALKQLVVLAEGAMKKHAPEGAGRRVHLRDTIDTRFERGGLKATVRPRKKTRKGIPLVEIITDDPTWTWDDPPPIPPLVEWADAKFGDDPLSTAFALRHHLVEEGATTMPNPFVDESIQEWEGQVESVAGKQVRQALGRMGGP